MGDYLKTATILYVEDDEEVRLGYARTLKRYAKELYVANNGEEGLALFRAFAPDIIISDIKMPRLSGIEMAHAIKSINPKQIILFTTAYSEAQYTLPALELHIDGYLLKPIDKKHLQAKINALSEQIILEKELCEYRSLIDHILNYQSNITLVTDFKTIKFASRSFWDILCTKNMKDFCHMYQSVLELFVEHPSYIYGKSTGTFLQRYFECENDMRLVSIVTENGPTAFFINLDKVHHIKEELFIVTLTDVTSLQASRLDALHHATYDKLTKVYNRHSFEKHFERELSRVQRHERPLCIALLDIDYFKRFNDKFGHLIGDEILVLLSQTITQTIRRTDLFARWGGEEFVLLMNETELLAALKLVETLRNKISHLHHPIAGAITISIGLAKASKHDTPQTIFERCDEALYRAKASGRNRVELA